MSKTSKEVIAKLKPHFARYGLPDRLISDNGPQFDYNEFPNFSKDYQFGTSKRPLGTPSPMEKRKTVSRQQSLPYRKLQIRVTIRICLYWILETHHQKEWIVPQHSVNSRIGLALYCPRLVSCFSQKMSLKWHRNCKLGNTSKLFIMTEGLTNYTR